MSFDYQHRNLHCGWPGDHQNSDGDAARAVVGVDIVAHGCAGGVKNQRGSGKLLERALADGEQVRISVQSKNIVATRRVRL